MSSLLLATALLHANCAEAASRFYWEMGTAITQIRTASPFFGGNAAGVLRLGVGFSGGVAVKLTSPKGSVGVHLGILTKYTSGSDASHSYSLLAPYPILRFEGARVFASLGATPLVWRRVGQSFGIDGLERKLNTVAALIEAGYLHPITPQVSLVGVIGTQFAAPLDSRSFSPRPAIELGASLRFYLGGNSPEGAQNKTPAWEEDFSGWRYPFGREKKH